MHNIDETKYKIVRVYVDGVLYRVENWFSIDPVWEPDKRVCLEPLHDFPHIFDASGDFTVRINDVERHANNVRVITEFLGDRSSERPCWDSYFLEIARVVATRADCRRRMVGCVIVDENHRIVSTGYNGAPAGDEGCLRGACPRGLLSYEEVAASTSYDEGPGRCISLHAEANALLYAGKDVRGATAYITDQPCPTCTKLLRGAGISRVVVEGRGM